MNTPVIPLLASIVFAILTTASISLFLLTLFAGRPTVIATVEAFVGDDEVSLCLFSIESTSKMPISIFVNGATPGRQGPVRVSGVSSHIDDVPSNETMEVIIGSLAPGAKVAISWVASACPNVDRLTFTVSSTDR